MKNKLLIIAMITSSFFLAAALPVQAADVTLTDPSGDVSMIDIYGEQSTYVTSNPDINIENIDLTGCTFTKSGGSATMTMTVKNVIEDRGSISIANGEYPENLTEINDVEYQFTLETKLVGSSAGSYSVIYVNKHCQYTTLESENAVNLTSPNGFSVSGNTLTVTIPLSNADEVYDQLNCTSTFMKVNISALSNATDPSDFSQYYTILEDICPNPALQVTILYAPNIGTAGESLQFNGSVIPLTGQPPFTYRWEFGDGQSSTQQNPLHTYTKSGTYTYNLTVTDHSNAKASETGSIEITTEGGGSSTGSSPILLFLAVIIVIAAVGIVALVIIIRRR